MKTTIMRKGLSILLAVAIAIGGVTGYIPIIEPMIIETEAAVVFNGNTDVAWNFFIGKGLTPVQAAGIMGAISVESSFNPAAHNPNDKGQQSSGLCQWRGGRRTAMINYVGANWATQFNKQLEFIWHEFMTTEKNAYNKLKAVIGTNRAAACEAGFIVATHYERCDIALRPKYREPAGKYFDKYNTSPTLPLTSPTITFKRGITRIGTLANGVQYGEMRQGGNFGFAIGNGQQTGTQVRITKLEGEPGKTDGSDERIEKTLYDSNNISSWRNRDDGGGGLTYPRYAYILGKGDPEAKGVANNSHGFEELKASVFTPGWYKIGIAGRRAGATARWSVAYFRVVAPVARPAAPNTNAISGEVDPTKQLNFTGYHDSSTYDLLINAFCDSCGVFLCRAEKVTVPHLSSFWLNQHKGCSIGVRFLHKNSAGTTDGNRIEFKVASDSTTPIIPTSKPIIERIIIENGDIVATGKHSSGTTITSGERQNKATGNKLEDGIITSDGKGSFTVRFPASVLVAGATYAIKVEARLNEGMRTTGTPVTWSDAKDISVPATEQRPPKPQVSAVSGTVDPTKDLPFTISNYDKSKYDLLINIACDSCRKQLCYKEEITSPFVSLTHLRNHQGHNIGVRFIFKNSVAETEGDRIEFKVGGSVTIPKPIISSITMSGGDIVFKGTYSNGTRSMKATRQATTGGYPIRRDEIVVKCDGKGKFEGRYPASLLTKGATYRIIVYAVGGAANEITVESEPKTITVPNSPTPPKSETYQHPLKGKGRVSSEYGNRKSGFHTGIDFSVAAGTAIYPTKSGKVVQVGWRGNFGYCVEVDHGGGVKTIYAHMVRTPNVKVGQTVNQNTVLGGVGSTGNSTGNHLHFEIRVNGSHKNPRNYVKF